MKMDAENDNDSMSDLESNPGLFILVASILTTTLNSRPIYINICVK